MPELPEVETMRRGVEAIVGSRVTKVERPPSPCKPILIRPRIDRMRRRIVGRTIVRTGRLGKRLILHFDHGDALAFEPRMTGLALIAAPPDLEHLRLRISLEAGACREFLFWDRRGLGTATLYDEKELTRRFGPDRLGPDALAITSAELRERAGASRRAIKAALLDQKVVAGIGNLYAAEILHVARIHPAVECRRLGPSQWEAIRDATRRVLRQAIRHEGSTLSDATYRNALNQAGRYQNYHRVYGRSGERCQMCGAAEIVRIVQGQRSTFFCPACQRKK